MQKLVITPPTSEPLSVDEARHHLRLDDQCGFDDNDIASWISAAREELEHELGRAVPQQTVRYEIESPSVTVYLPDALSVSAVSSYEGSTWNAVTGFSFDATGKELTSPTGGWAGQAIRVTAVAGFQSVPKSLVSWLKLRVADLFEHRETAIVGASTDELQFARHLYDRYIVYENK